MRGVRRRPCRRRTGVPEIFSQCPPAFGLLLYLRKTPGHHSPQCGEFTMLIYNFLAELGAWRIRRSEIKGETAKQAEDIRGGGYAVPPAAPEK
jgi:hypothetical protein